MQDNPILVEVTRGGLVESCHRGAVAIADADGRVLLGLGDIERPVYPRSAVKALQAIPLIESGAAEAFGLRQAELAIACASHSGDETHIGAVRTLLAKAGLDESLLACGAHWPIGDRASRELSRLGKSPMPIHNNCSGKHAGMLATAVHLGLDPRGYERPEHKVQQEIRRVISEICDVTLEQDEIGIDGCSVPTFALPLAAVATGFARLASGRGLEVTRAEAARRLMDACFAAPDLVAGEGRFDTIVMRGLPGTAFAKGGAEESIAPHCRRSGSGLPSRSTTAPSGARRWRLPFCSPSSCLGPNTSLPANSQERCALGAARRSARLARHLRSRPRSARCPAKALPLLPQRHVDRLGLSPQANAPA